MLLPAHDSPTISQVVADLYLPISKFYLPQRAFLLVSDLSLNLGLFYCSLCIVLLFYCSSIVFFSVGGSWWNTMEHQWNKKESNYGTNR